ncbi:MAG: hypothetical protein HOE90_02925 [Bacteriovoracaceae bacterium]|jgi:hypothetical protein|nr:hypothetical protein [Bacteriovoracaceae bacterium]
MAKLTYNLKRLERCIFSLYDDMKTPDDILKTWNIEEKWIDQAWGELSTGKTLIGGIPTSKIKMLDVWKWEYIVDPPVDDNYQPLWNEAPGDAREMITDGEDLCSLLLIFSIEGGNPMNFIVDNRKEDTCF